MISVAKKHIAKRMGLIDDSSSKTCYIVFSWQPLTAESKFKYVSDVGESIGMGIVTFASFGFLRRPRIIETRESILPKDAIPIANTRAMLSSIAASLMSKRVYEVDNSIDSGTWKMYFQEGRITKKINLAKLSENDSLINNILHLGEFIDLSVGLHPNREL